jgi:cell division septation protein DedD
MYKQRILFLLAALGLSLSAPSQPQPIDTVTNEPFFTGDPSLMQAQASNEGKLYILYFSAGWCMPCQWMEENTFSDTSLKGYLDLRYLILKVDIDDQDGRRLQRQFEVRALPTLLIFNSQGQLLQRFEEALPADKLVAQLEIYDLPFNRLVVAVPLPPPSVEEALTAVSLPISASSIEKNGESFPSLLPEAPAVIAKPVVTHHAEYGALPEAEPEFPALPMTEQEAAGPSFGVQVGAFSRLDNARKLIGRLETQISAPLVIQPVQRDDGILYKVIAGSFPAQTEAERLLRQLQSRSVKGFVQALE